MAVIAKVFVQAIRRMGTGTLVEIGCVYDNDLSQKDHENYRFTQASPWGDGRLQLCGPSPFGEREEVYAIFTRSNTAPPFHGAMLASPIRCNSVTDFGGTSKQVELCNPWRDHGDKPVYLHRGIDGVNFRMSIDNPAASVQFEAGAGDYWVGFYSAKTRTMAEAIELAHQLGDYLLED